MESYWTNLISGVKWWNRRERIIFYYQEYQEGLVESRNTKVEVHSMGKIKQRGHMVSGSNDFVWKRDIVKWRGFEPGLLSLGNKNNKSTQLKVTIVIFSRETQLNTEALGKVAFPHVTQKNFVKKDHVCNRGQKLSKCSQAVCSLYCSSKVV